MYLKPALTSIDVQRMMNACKEEAVKNQWRVSIAIVDEGGYLLHLERMDGAVLQSPDIAWRKARTSALARNTTKALEAIAKERPGTLTFPDRLPVQGGVALLFDGQCVGAIGVSGAASADDEVIALAGAALMPASLS
ncbi:MAG: heme-binding protein [Rickettsiales bacterium]|nr:heme-binding protein [Rickettsiales bacterium]